MARQNIICYFLMLCLEELLITLWEVHQTEIISAMSNTQKHCLHKIYDTSVNAQMIRILIYNIFT